jgi:ABC-type dipeptide/oligopeptide/nickel transport system permease component
VNDFLRSVAFLVLISAIFSAVAGVLLGTIVALANKSQEAGNRVLLGTVIGGVAGSIPSLLIGLLSVALKTFPS